MTCALCLPMFVPVPRGPCSLYTHLEHHSFPHAVALKSRDMLAQRLTKLGYLAVGLAAALPCALLPLIIQPAAERGKPWSQRFWVKSQVRDVLLCSWHRAWVGNPTASWQIAVAKPV